MSDIKSNENPGAGLSDKLRAIAPWAFALIIILGYLLLLYGMSKEAGGTDEKWTKLTYLFSSVEAIVFTVIGFVFGREVNRSRAIKAEHNEANAKKEKNDLAKSVLESLPNTMAVLDNKSVQLKGVDSLRAMAKIYLDT